MSNHPYIDRPNYAYWSSGMADVAPGFFDPVVQTKFRIRRQEKIVTIGSCFAANLARRLTSLGFTHLVAESSGLALGDAGDNGAPFSAKYGNVYRVRQALQLLERAFLQRDFSDDVWKSGSRYFDAFRPRFLEGGFPSEAACRQARGHHLLAVRRAFTEADVVVFTLGLTEGWESSRDGAAYPLAPGVTAGTFDESRYTFVNDDYDAVRRDLEQWFKLVKSINPRTRCILTVSPVPLAATFEDRHVWTSSSYSKATLLAASQDFARTQKDVDYFPSFEIVTSPCAQGRYFGSDLRSIEQVGVQHVMKLFARHYGEIPPSASWALAGESPPDFRADELDRQSRTICDDDLLDV